MSSYCASPKPGKLATSYSLCEALCSCGPIALMLRALLNSSSLDSLLFTKQQQTKSTLNTKSAAPPAIATMITQRVSQFSISSPAIIFDESCSIVVVSIRIDVDDNDVDDVVDVDDVDDVDDDIVDDCLEIGIVVLVVASESDVNDSIEIDNVVANVDVEATVVDRAKKLSS